MRSPNRDEIWEAQALIVVRDAAQQGEDTPGRGCEPLFFNLNRSKLLHSYLKLVPSFFGINKGDDSATL